MKKILKQTYKLKTSPSSEPLSLSEVKIHLKIDSDCTDEDTYLTSLITVARQSVESYCAILIGSQVWNMYQDVIDYETEINKLPVISLDTFTYVDEDGNTQTMASYTDVYEDLASYPARIKTEDIPSLYEYGYNQVSFEFTAGLTVIPEPLKQAMLLMIGHWYENRQDVVTGTQVNEVPETSKYLMNPYIYYEFR